MFCFWYFSYVFDLGDNNIKAESRTLLKHLTINLTSKNWHFKPYGNDMNLDHMPLVIHNEVELYLYNKVAYLCRNKS